MNPSSLTIPKSVWFPGKGVTFLCDFFQLQEDGMNEQPLSSIHEL